MNLLVSCSSYVLGQLFGPERACEMITEAVQHPGKKPPCFAVRAIHTLTKLANVTLRVDGGSSHIGKSRTRHFFEALTLNVDAWVTIDDDVSASPETLAWLLAAIDANRPHVCIAPCALRLGKAVNVEWSPVYYERTLPPLGGSCRRALAGGFGLVAMNRAAIREVAAASPPWHDPHDGKTKPAPFVETLTEGVWFGEDIAFFRRLPKTVNVEALTSGKTMHAGHELALESLHS